jgi:hypothetical protein
MVAKRTWFYDPGILYVKQNFLKIQAVRNVTKLEDESSFII